MGRYRIWNDKESVVEVPMHVEQYYDDYDDAYDAASEIVHEHDGQAYKAIIHIEDLVAEETIETLENEK